MENILDEASITEILIASGGGRDAVEVVVPLLYHELKKIASGKLHRAGRGVTLNTTSLLHETYLKLVQTGRATYSSRGHFLAVVATAMRHIIVDYARRQQAEKRGGQVDHVPLEEADTSLSQEAESMIAIDRVLQCLDGFDQRLRQLVECRIFAGYSVEETATALGISKSTVKRDWIRARAWLMQELGEHRGMIV